MPPAGTALQRLKDAQRARQQGGSAGQRQHLASASDADNEAYIQRFGEAFSSLSTAAPGFLSAAATAPITATATAKVVLPSSNDRTRITQGATANSSTIAANKSNRQASSIDSRIAGGSRQASAARRSPCLQKAPNHEHSSSRQHERTSETSRGAVCTAEAAAGPPAMSMQAARASWRNGPVDAAGLLVQLSDRPFLCSAANWASNEVVIGSSDHASYVVDAAAGKKRRTLYSKTTGHTEWVTSVCCLPSGRVLSGGMDGRLWLWPASGSAGSEIAAAHAAPVSKVTSLTPVGLATAGSVVSTGSATASSSRCSAGVKSGRAAAAAGPVLAVSCSYDKTLKVWDVSGSRGKQIAMLQGHAGPVLEMAVHPSGRCIATGDRKGSLMCWDLDCGSSSWGAAAAHQGHITALAWSTAAAAASGASAQAAGDNSSCCLISGGQDGVVRVWAGRTGRCVAEQAVHVDKKGKGAVGNILTGCGSSGSLIVTAGADMTLKVLDPDQFYKPIHTVQLTDFPYSLIAAASDLVLCGCGDGSVHVVDVQVGKTLYALGAGKAAVRAMEVSPDGSRLVCAGDDGCVICYEFR